MAAELVDSKNSQTLQLPSPVIQSLWAAVVVSALLETLHRSVLSARHQVAALAALVERHQAQVVRLAAMEDREVAEVVPVTQAPALPEQQVQAHPAKAQTEQQAKKAAEPERTNTAAAAVVVAALRPLDLSAATQTAGMAATAVQAHTPDHRLPMPEVAEQAPESHSAVVMAHQEPAEQAAEELVEEPEQEQQAARTLAEAAEAAQVVARAAQVDPASSS